MTTGARWLGVKKANAIAAVFPISLSHAVGVSVVYVFGRVAQITLQCTIIKLYYLIMNKIETINKIIFCEKRYCEMNHV